MLLFRFSANFTDGTKNTGTSEEKSWNDAIKLAKTFMHSDYITNVRINRIYKSTGKVSKTFLMDKTNYMNY